MCDVMPTISEDISQRGSQFNTDDGNFEQLMVSMLDERDKLLDTVRETQDRLGEVEQKYQELEKERNSLQRQLDANLPQVCNLPSNLVLWNFLNLSDISSELCRAWDSYIQYLHE